MRREVLRSLALGPMDWTVDAALLAMSEVARHEPEARVEVGQLLRASGVPVIELRASIVIGSGSLSFEMIRSLVEHLPVLVTPRWVSMPAQPVRPIASR